MTDQRRYAWSERHLYDPGPCPRCGSTNVTVDWKDASTGTNPDAWLPGLKTCHARDCPANMGGDLFESSPA